MYDTDIKRSFHQLFDFEYGAPAELVLRFSIISVATALFTIETGWIIGIIWLAIYFPFHAANYVYFLTKRQNPTELDIKVASAMFLGLIVAFIWLPGFLLLQENLAMQLAGAAAILGMVLWLIRRSELSLTLLVGEIVVVALSMITFLVFAVTKIETLAEQIAVVLAGMGSVIYFALTMLMSRRHHKRAQEAALRSAEAEKMKALGHLAGGVAHDFNNVLTATIGNLELHGEVRTASDRAQCLEEALLAARSGEALVRKLLAFGREPESNEHSVALYEMLDGLQALSKRLLPAPIRLHIDAPHQDLIVPVSGQDLTTALLNLIVNARDAMPEGGTLALSISSQAIERARMMLDGAPIPPGHYVRFDVSDNGPGMPPNVLNRVLEPFFTTKPEGKGSGLGLPLVAEFARAARGGLTIATSPHGTCVSIYLPCSATQPDVTANAA